MNKIKTNAGILGLVIFCSFICFVLPMSCYYHGVFAMINSSDWLISFIGMALFACFSIPTVWFSCFILGINLMCVRDFWDAVFEFAMEHQQDEEEDRQLEEIEEEVLKEETEQEQGKGLVDEPIIL